MNLRRKIKRVGKLGSCKFLKPRCSMDTNISRWFAGEVFSEKTNEGFVLFNNCGSHAVGRYAERVRRVT